MCAPLTKLLPNRARRKVADTFHVPPANCNGGTASDQYYSASWQLLEEMESTTTKRQYVWSPVYVDSLILRDRDANATGGDGVQSLGLEQRHYAQHDANLNDSAVVPLSLIASAIAAGTAKPCDSSQG